MSHCLGKSVNPDHENRELGDVLILVELPDHVLKDDFSVKILHLLFLADAEAKSDSFVVLSAIIALVTLHNFPELFLNLLVDVSHESNFEQGVVNFLALDGGVNF